MDAIGLACLISGCVLLIIMIVCATAGTTPLWLHAVAIAGGTLGGLAGGAICESGGMLVCAFGHLTGAVAATAALTGIAAANERI